MRFIGSLEFLILKIALRKAHAQLRKERNFILYMREDYRRRLFVVRDIYGHAIKY
jgi:hypothetical protein